MNNSTEIDRLNLGDVVHGLRSIFAEDQVNIDQVKSLLRAYRSNSKDWLPFTKFDATRYTRNLLDGGNGKYNVIILCWSEGQGSPIHAHADSNCFVKVLDGQITETMYAWPEQDEYEEPMRVLKRTPVKVDDVTYINDALGLHRMENTSHTETTVTLHVYVPAYQECLTFDERSGHRNTSQIVFHRNLEDTLESGAVNEQLQTSGGNPMPPLDELSISCRK